jgi:polysaccharide biosynthesis protein PslG
VWRYSLCVIVLILTAFALIAVSRSADKPVSFGISDPFLVSQTPKTQIAQLRAMKVLGISSVRVEANWRSIQPGGPEVFDWSQLDQEIDSIRSAGMSVDLVIDGCPPWAAVVHSSDDPSPQPASSAQYAAFAAQVAKRYSPKGVNTFEIWNEPNNVDFWQPGANAAAYTADLKAAYAAIKKVDPAAFVVSGGFAPETTGGGSINAVTFLQEMYADGAKGSFDALGYHPYSYPALPNTYEAWSGWSQMDQTSPSIRSVMTSNGDSAKKIWITEVGAPSGGPDGVGQAAQATDLTQAIADAKSTRWIGAIYLYSWQDEGTSQSTDEDWFGLVTAAGVPKLAYTAVAAAIK